MSKNRLNFSMEAVEQLGVWNQFSEMGTVAIKVILQKIGFFESVLNFL